MAIPDDQKKSMILMTKAQRLVDGGTAPPFSAPPKGPGWIVGGDDYRRAILPEKLEEACRLFREAFETSPDVMPLQALAFTLESLGEYEEAAKTYRHVRQLAEKNGDDVYAKYAPGHIATCQKKAKDKSWTVVRKPQPKVKRAASKDPPHLKVARDFALALVAGDFDAAHRMLSVVASKQSTAAKLKTKYAAMMKGFGPPPEIVEVGGVLDEWPDRKPGDAGWVYVAMTGEGESAGVTVVVAEESGKLVVRSIEWGRP